MVPLFFFNHYILFSFLFSSAPTDLPLWLWVTWLLFIASGYTDVSCYLLPWPRDRLYNNNWRIAYNISEIVSAGRCCRRSLLPLLLDTKQWNRGGRPGGVSLSIWYIFIIESKPKLLSNRIGKSTQTAIGPKMDTTRANISSLFLFIYLFFVFFFNSAGASESVPPLPPFGRHWSPINCATRPTLLIQCPNPIDLPPTALFLDAESNSKDLYGFFFLFSKIFISWTRGDFAFGIDNKVEQAHRLYTAAILQDTLTISIW